MSSSKSIFFITFFLFSNFVFNTNGYDFDKFSKDSGLLTAAELRLIDSLSDQQWVDIAQYGIDSVNKEKAFENNILSAQIVIKNGSLSHAQLLDTLPNKKAKKDSEVAKKILKASVYFHDLKCIEKNIDDLRCGALLSHIEIPKSSSLAGDCAAIITDSREGHHAFRRLLPRFYRDGIHSMFGENFYPAPRKVSRKALQKNESTHYNHQKTLALVQWAQFIEHDLSKPVATSMSSGDSIECCAHDNFKLAPRHSHRACAPLLGWDSVKTYGRISCLNYVRSALAVGSECTFGAAEQLNQATGYFDLSQLYGFTRKAEHRMRTFRDGELKATAIDNESPNKQLLPMAPSNSSNSFCAFKTTGSNENICFMAGDSRVNSNPFAILIYTVFLRNHNRIAKELKQQFPEWHDKRLFVTAKAINIDIYRRIIYREWLPEILGRELADRISHIPLEHTRIAKDHTDYHISNEFGIAAIRFYFSMLPDVLFNFAMWTENKTHHHDLFILKDQMYKPDLQYTPMKLDEILESLLHHPAMTMDSTYVSSLIPDDVGSARAPTHADILAFDIQRGRDHGLQPYVKYLENCENTKINSWQDLEKYILRDDLNKLKGVYEHWDRIDLIIGGISEKPIVDGTVGPTFSCILAEQFAKIRAWQGILGTNADVDTTQMDAYKDMTAADLLCANSNLKYVQKNIFQASSQNNRWLECPEKI